MALTLQPGGLPLGVNLGEDGAVVTNYGAGSVSYSDTEAPFVAEGTIASGAIATLNGTQFFVSAAGAVLDIRPLPSPAARLLSVERGQLLPTIYSMDGAGSAKGLRRWYQAIANALNAQAHVSVVGDSHVFGQGGNDANTGAAADNVADSTQGWVGQLRQLAQLSEAGGATLAGEGFIFAGGSTVEGRVVTAGSPSSTKPHTAPLRRGLRLLNGTAQTLTYTVETGVTSLGIIQANQAQAFNSAGTNLADVSALYSNSGAGGSGVVTNQAVTTLTNTGVPLTTYVPVLVGDVITISRPLTAQTYVTGTVARKATTGVLVHRIGVPGQVIGDALGGQTSGVLTQTAASDLNLAVDTLGAWRAPGLTILSYLTNDQSFQSGGGTTAQNGITAALFASWAAQIVTRLVANGDCVLLLGGQRGGSTLGVPDSEAAYIAALRTIALSTDHVAFADMGQVFGTSAAMVAAGQQFASSSHMKQAGHAVFARAVWRLLNPAGHYGYTALAPAA